MTKKILPTPNELRQLLTYQPETGKLFWLPRPKELFATPRSFGLWNTRFSNKEAFTAIKGSGYRHGKVFGKPLLAHRVIWAMQTGAWPSVFVDHIDGDKLNNKWDNLREASHSQNMHNQSVRSTNSSGYKGVDWDKRARKFRAQISKDGKKFFIGYYPDPESAHAAYCEAANKMHGDFAKFA